MNETFRAATFRALPIGATFRFGTLRLNAHTGPWVKVGPSRYRHHADTLLVCRVSKASVPVIVEEDIR